MKIKQDKPQHNHRLTEYLKVAIFALFMLMPFASIGTTCAYAIMNENANQSYYGETINDQQTIYENNTLQPNVIYYLTNSENLTTGTTRANINNISIVDIKTNTENTTTTTIREDLSNITQMWLYLNPNITNAYSIALKGTTTYYLPINNFQYVSFTTNVQQTNTQYLNNIYRIEYNQYSYLSDSFAYAVDNLENQALFRWTKNTATYNTIKLVTEGLENTNNFIPVTLTYMFMVTIIYLIIDIVITCIVWLTHSISGAKD